MTNLNIRDAQSPSSVPQHRPSLGSCNDLPKAPGKRTHGWMRAILKKLKNYRISGKTSPNEVSASASLIEYKNTDDTTFVPCTAGTRRNISSMTSDSVTDSNLESEKEKIVRLGEYLFSCVTQNIKSSPLAPEIVERRRSWATISTFDPSIDELVKFECLTLAFHSDNGMFLGHIKSRLDTCADANVLIRKHAEDFGWTDENRLSKLPNIRTLNGIELPTVGCFAIGVEIEKNKKQVRTVFHVVEDEVLLGIDCILSESFIKSKQILVEAEEIRDSCMRIAEAWCRSGRFQLPGFESS